MQEKLRASSSDDPIPSPNAAEVTPAPVPSSPAAPAPAATPAAPSLPQAPKRDLSKTRGWWDYLEHKVGNALGEAADHR